MRTTTFRGLAAGAGIAAVLVAGSASAFAAPDTTDSGQGSEAYWVDHFTKEGYADVACASAGWQAGEEPSSIVLDQQTYDLIPEGQEWAGLVVSSGGEPTVYEKPAVGTYEASDGEGISQVITCGGVPDAAPVADEPAAEPQADEAGTSDAAGTGGAATDDAKHDDAKDDDAAETGPAVETDGPAEDGPNLLLVGGATLALAGAGGAAWAMRRRPQAR